MLSTMLTLELAFSPTIGRLPFILSVTVGAMGLRETVEVIDAVPVFRNACFVAYLSASYFTKFRTI